MATLSAVVVVPPPSITSPESLESTSLQGMQDPIATVTDYIPPLNSRINNTSSYDAILDKIGVIGESTMIHIATQATSSDERNALDALTALASSSAFVAIPISTIDATTDVSTDTASTLPQSPTAITPHQTSSDDDDSEVMPPPPPCSPTTATVIASSYSSSITIPSNLSGASPTMQQQHHSLHPSHRRRRHQEHQRRGWDGAKRRPLQPIFPWIG